MSENRLLTALRTALRLALEHLGLAAPPIHYIGGSDVLPPPLPRDEEEAAIRGLAEDVYKRQPPAGSGGTPSSPPG